MRKQLGFLIHADKCIGCHACEFSCRSEHELGDYYRRQIVPVQENTENVFTHFSMACNHCLNPSCMTACAHQCIKKKRDGIVILDPTYCTGCNACVIACPFQAITLNPTTGKADKCDMCSQRQGQGNAPICVDACSVGAIEVIDINSEEAKGYKKAIHGYQMKSVTNPSIRFSVEQHKMACFWLKEEGKE